MREFKFRVWTGREMVVDCQLYSVSLSGEITINTGSGGEKYLPENILLQFTGLKDKNGVEIYEGDIVRVQYRYDADVGPVSYLEHETRFVWSPNGLKSDDGGGLKYRDLGHGAYGIEVIGNIHANPELLK